MARIRDEMRLQLQSRAIKKRYEPRSGSPYYYWTTANGYNSITFCQHSHLHLSSSPQGSISPRTVSASDSSNITFSRSALPHPTFFIFFFFFFLSSSHLHRVALLEPPTSPYTSIDLNHINHDTHSRQNGNRSQVLHSRSSRHTCHLLPPNHRRSPLRCPSINLPPAGFASRLC